MRSDASKPVSKETLKELKHIYLMFTPVCNIRILEIQRSRRGNRGVYQTSE